MAYGNKGLGQSGLPATASTHEATVVPGDYALEVKLRAASSESKPSQQTRQYGSSQGLDMLDVLLRVEALNKQKQLPDNIDLIQSTNQTRQRDLSGGNRDKKLPERPPPVSLERLPVAVETASYLSQPSANRPYP